MFPMLYNVFRLAFEFDVSDFQRRRNIVVCLFRGVSLFNQSELSLVH